MKLIVHIRGIAPHIDGEYPLEWEGAQHTFTLREQQQIKTICGVRPAEYIEAFVAQDGGFGAAVATVVCQRAKKRINEDFFLDAPAAAVVEIVVPVAEDVPEDPPTSVPPKRGTKRRSSGSGSRSSSAIRADALNRSGEPT